MGWYFPSCMRARELANGPSPSLWKAVWHCDIELPEGPIRPTLYPFSGIISGQVGMAKCPVTIFKSFPLKPSIPLYQLFLGGASCSLRSAVACVGPAQEGKGAEYIGPIGRGTHLHEFHTLFHCFVSTMGLLHSHQLLPPWWPDHPGMFWTAVKFLHTGIKG